MFCFWKQSFSPYKSLYLEAVMQHRPATFMFRAYAKFKNCVSTRAKNSNVRLKTGLQQENVMCYLFQRFSVKFRRQLDQPAEVCYELTTCSLTKRESTMNISSEFRLKNTNLILKTNTLATEQMPLKDTCHSRIGLVLAGVII